MRGPTPSGHGQRIASWGLATLTTLLVAGWSSAQEPSPPVPDNAVGQAAHANANASPAASSKATSTRKTPKPEPILKPRPNDNDRKIRIRKPDGTLVVTRVYGVSDKEVVVALPDGSLGFVDGMAETDRPFAPLTREELRDQLLAGPYTGFSTRLTPHYVIVYNCSDTFAVQSGNLLESLYAGLTRAFLSWGLPVHEAEFPLVAVIYARESDFRARRQIEPEVQAYYEILSNQIVFFEKSERDQNNPEIAAMRKPQTIAHEGAHQILQNIGVQPRLAPWPIWLVEGLAEFCAPTTTKKRAEWAGLGKINAIHMATIRDLNEPVARLFNDLGLQQPQLERAPNTPLVAHLVTRQELNPTEYALAWALTFHLASKRNEEFVGYLKAMAELKPLEKRTPAQQLELFRAHFKRELPQIDKDVTRHLDSLKNYEKLPYYAVLFQYPIPGNRIRRAAFVSQSPSIIQQQLLDINRQLNGRVRWQVVPCPNRSQAQLVAQQLLNSPP